MNPTASSEHFKFCSLSPIALLIGCILICFEFRSNLCSDWSPGLLLEYGCRYDCFESRIRMCPSKRQVINNRFSYFIELRFCALPPRFPSMRHRSQFLMRRQIEWFSIHQYLRHGHINIVAITTVNIRIWCKRLERENPEQSKNRFESSWLDNDLPRGKTNVMKYCEISQVFYII
jgi:hypothetical protein